MRRRPPGPPSAWRAAGQVRRGGAVIGKVSVPRGKRVEPLIWYLYGPGKKNEHTDPHLVAAWRDPAGLEPPIGRTAGGTSAS